MQEILRLRTAYWLTLTPDGPARPDWREERPKRFHLRTCHPPRMSSRTPAKKWKGEGPFIPRLKAGAFLPCPVSHSPRGPRTDACGGASGGVTWAKRGQCTLTVLVPQGSRPMNSGFSWQVGQDSNRHPAVVEHAARCPDSSKVVQYRLEFADFDDASSRVVQERPAGM